MKRNTQQPTVTFQNPNVSSSAEGCEEVDYVNVAVSAEDNLSAILDEKPRSLTQSVPTIAVSWVILSVILALDIYFTSVISENNTKLTEQNQELKTENKELKTHSNNLRQQQQQIQDKETEWIQSNVSRAQWSIDAYCPIGIKGRQCKPCQAGWLFNKSSCYIFGNPPPNEWQTWTEAREDCRRRGSDLVVIADQTEKTYVNDKSFKPNGFWIGLRAVDGKWKWVDGSDLNEDLWGQAAVEGQCAILFKNQRWRSVSCSKRHQWVCGHTALSVK